MLRELLAMIILVSISIIGGIVISDITSVEAADGFTEFSLLEDNGYLQFVITNNEGKTQTYTLQIIEETEDGKISIHPERISLADNGQASVYYPKQMMVTATLSPSMHELSFREEIPEEQPYVEPEREWRPEIIPDLPWERQDPIVRNFYRYVYDDSWSYEYERS